MPPCDVHVRFVEVKPPLRQVGQAVRVFSGGWCHAATALVSTHVPGSYRRVVAGVSVMHREASESTDQESRSAGQQAHVG